MLDANNKEAGMNNPVGLSAEQLHEVTGFRHSSRQCSALAEMDIPFRVRPNGTPFVALADLTGAPDKNSMDPHQEPTLNFEP